MKPRFAMVSIVALHVYLNKEMVIAAKSRTQIKVAYQLMCQYYDLHQRAGIYIGDYYTNEQYVFYKNILGEEYSNDFQGAIKYSFDSFYRFNEADFKCFSNSRKSIRNFTGEKVNEVLIRDAVQLAMNAPSVCNRQSAKVYLVEDKVKIDKILEIQGGFRGYTEQVGQLLILTTDRNYFYTIGERNQLYIDGGIFLMNLLYALHYYKIANCPANWGKTVQEEEVLSKYIFLPNSEKIICMVPIGVANPEFSVCLSRRRDIDEVFISL
ncbi:nitroreductase family protein [Olivibacter sitiensis]|uniref:nitroreductase family protein n=1 Tax=Olivibacter sitiensis TaxID=376470 RepID=UPI001B7FE9D5|nr:nitroreductase family protein [Olivibacter sitiensis]